MNNPLRHFEDVRYYPGSNKVIRERPVVGPNGFDPDAWDANPLTFKVKGEDREFFTISQLAQALDGRSSVTIRTWESKGWIPKATHYKPGRGPQGRRRLYSRAQVEGIVAIAKEEGIFPNQSRVKISTTNFTKRVVALFRELAAA